MLQIIESGEEPDLPEAAKLDIGKSLVAEPEPIFLDDAHEAEIVAEQRAGDDQHRNIK